MNWYKRYLGDYMSKTAHLSLMEQGAYNVLLDHCYSTEKSLPADHEHCYRIARAFTKDERAAVDTVLQQFFRLTEDGYINGRVKKELGKASEQAEINKANGKRGGRPRKSEEEPNENPSGFEEETDTKGTTRLPDYQTPDTKTSTPPDTKDAGTMPAPKSNGKAKTTDLWEAYSEAYQRRYGVPPVRNAKVNTQLSQFIDRIGTAEAPFVAAYYLTSNNAWYVKQGHSVGVMLSDAEKLRTEWATRRQTTSRQANELDRKSQDRAEWEALLEGVEHAGSH